MYIDGTKAGSLMRAYRNDYLFKKSSGWYVCKSGAYALNIRTVDNGDRYVLGMVMGIRFLPGLTAVPVETTPDMTVHEIQDAAVKAFMAARDKIAPIDERDRKDFEKGIRNMERTIQRFYGRLDRPVPGTGPQD